MKMKFIMWFYRIICIFPLLLVLQSCGRDCDSQFDLTAKEVLEFRNLFWTTGDTTYIYQGVMILDSLLSTNLSHKDYAYCENLLEQLYLDVGKIKDAMALRIQVIDSSKHPEAFYESMAIVSYCNNEIDKMKDYSQKASQKFGELAKQSSGNQKAIYIQRQIDTNILNSNYQKADSLYLLLRTLDSKNYCLNFDCYYKEVRSNLEELKQQYNECGE